MNKKICINCLLEKEVTEFNHYKNKKGRQSICRDCDNKRSKTWYLENKIHRINKNKARKDSIKKYFNEYKRTLFCTDCNFSGKEFPTVIEFDHTSDNKERTVSGMVAVGLSIKNIMIEIAKCDPVCANCHRIRTEKRRMGILV